MTKIVVDGKEIDVPPEYTLLQACEAAGAEIPRFCYHERLSIAGNCRMCLVEVKGGPKPVASCAWGVRDCRPGPKGEPPEISTRSPMVKKAREGVMEFLLINHPLDCPICDQGGECDLQDQAMGYGVDTSRFAENKRAVEDKYLGALVKTSMNRCIQCTRCVRFSAEVCGVPEMGATGRGEDMEITTYLESALSSELQGNLVDICPVGALTSKPYAFAARPWELGKPQSIDVMDGIGSGIRVDTRGREVMRILPRVNEAVNEEWISDKTRHVVDGLRTQRLDRPYIRENGQLRAASWADAFAAIAARTRLSDGKRIGAVAGDVAAVEEMFALRDLLAKYGSVNLAVQGGDAVLALAARLAADFGALKDGWNGFGVLQDTASRAGALDIGFAPGAGGLSLAQMATFGTLDVLFLLGADEVKVPDGTFVVYIGTHGDRGAHRADVILPGAAYTEKSGLYVNTEGRAQIASRAAFPPGEAREDWAIVRALSDVLGKKLPYDSLGALRQALFKAVPHLMRIDQIEASKAEDVKALAGKKGGKVDKTPFKSSVEDFYLTNPIARASAVMAECSRLASGKMLTAAE